VASTTFVRTRVHGAVAELQLDRAEALNSLTPEMMDAIAGELEAIDAARAVRAAVIAGHDRAFVAGSDIRLLRERPFDAVLTKAGVKFWTRLAAIDVPLIAAVSGFALGGGCELALACDMIVASETAVFAQAEINLGIMPGGGGTQRLARTVGKYLAMEMVLTGRRVTAAEAYHMGFVNRVTAPDRWRAEALELAAEIASKPPLAVMLAKRAVLGAEETSLTAGMSLERRLYEVSMATNDRAEGMTAFLEKREARWEGR
jgi:enoyl-CoA hydratase/carnithine racemase